jgi:hypothetical protein
MPTIIVHHEVTNTDHWLSSPKREEVLPTLGISNIRTFVDRDNPRKVAVLFDVADLDALLAVLANPPAELAEAMQYDGVLPETMSILVAS